MGQPQANWKHLREGQIQVATVSTYTMRAEVISGSHGEWSLFACGELLVWVVVPGPCDLVELMCAVEGELSRRLRATADSMNGGLLGSMPTAKPVELAQSEPPSVNNDSGVNTIRLDPALFATPSYCLECYQIKLGPEPHRCCPCDVES
jgi:hypothetical protein